MMKGNIGGRAWLCFKGRSGKSALYISFSVIFGLCLAVISCYITAGNSYVDEIADGIQGRVTFHRSSNYEEGFAPKDNWITALNYHSNVEYYQHEGESVLVYLRDYKLIESTMRELNTIVKNSDEYGFFDISDMSLVTLYQSVKMSLGLQNLTLYIAVVVLIAVFFVLFVNMNITFNKDKKILIRLGETNKNIFKQFVFLQGLWVYIPVFISSIIGLFLNGVISQFWINSSVEDSEGFGVMSNYDAQREALSSLQIDGHILQFLMFTLVFALIYIIVLYGSQRRGG